MIKKNIIVLLISTAAGIGIITILSFFIVWIGFPVENPKDSFKDALDFSGGLLGGLATFGSAIIAAYLFNDWKEQERITFIRDIAHDTANLITQLMLSMQQYPQLSVSEIRVLHSKIVTNLSFLNRQIEDDQMDKVNGNFGVFMKDFYGITITGIDNSTPPERIKKEINENIKSFNVEYAYIANLIDINKVYEKIKNLQPKKALT